MTPVVQETPEKKPRPWRVWVLSLAVVFFVVAAILAILNSQGTIHGSWSAILTYLFGISAGGITFFELISKGLSLFSSDDKEPKPPQVVIHFDTRQGTVTQADPASTALSAAFTPVSAQSSGSAEINNLRTAAHTAISPSTVFLFCEPLTDAREFYGRVRERQTLIDRTYKGASTSIVGSRRIGKTWLLRYLKLIAPTQLGERFHVGYLDATSPGCSTVPGFTTRALQELGIPTFASKRSLGLAALEKAVQELSAKNQPLVLCIDEFEGLYNRQEFDLHFFTGLRAMASAGLVLVIASKSPLIEIVGDPGHTSGFFNIFQQLTLALFSAQEAEKFAQAKGAQAGFNAEELERLLQYGQRLPIRLQLVGQMLSQDKTLAANEDSNLYRPKDPTYWQDLEARLEQTYRGVVHS